MKFASVRRSPIVIASVVLAMHGWALAATVQGTFVVSVKLEGICTSASLSHTTNATVWVTCQGNQFVSIEPQPGKPFIGTHGGAHRFAFSQRAGLSGVPISFGQSVTELDAAVGQGTITALRVLNLTERDERLELLVSF